MTFSLSQQVYRIEPPTNGGGTVIAIEGDKIEIAYDEGGTGWWPAECLSASLQP